jgi:hypothetical protein
MAQPTGKAAKPKLVLPKERAKSSFWSMPVVWACLCLLILLVGFLGGQYWYDAFAWRNDAKDKVTRLYSYFEAKHGASTMPKEWTSGTAISDAESLDTQFGHVVSFQIIDHINMGDEEEIDLTVNRGSAGNATEQAIVERSGAISAVIRRQDPPPAKHR